MNAKSAADFCVQPGLCEFEPLLLPDYTVVEQNPSDRMSYYCVLHDNWSDSETQTLYATTA